MLFFKKLNIFLLVNLLIGISCSADNQISLKADQYVIHLGESTDSQLWATYFYNQLRNRTTDKKAVVLTIQQGKQRLYANTKHIYIGVDPLLNKDYCIDHNKERLDIKSREGASVKWIIYQLIEAISQVDERFQTPDLSPAVLDFKSTCKKFDFTYREPHYRENLEQDQSGVLGNNQVELDWGLWGHHLENVLPIEPHSTIYAHIDGVAQREQFCFTSDSLYEYVLEYIIDNYGDDTEVKEQYRFVIAPNDNGLVCACLKCKQLNESSIMASESVAYLVNKLAKRFPKYEFYTLGYLTTKTIPKVTLEKNVGVLLSTIDLPKGVSLEEKYLKKQSVVNFIKEVEVWRAKTDKVILWDYSSNFDDYLSPIPVLYSLKKQLRFFKELGVSGVFLNASGYDYSSFSDVQNYVATALMKDTSLAIDTLVRNFYRKKYPKSQEWLAAYYLGMEKKYEELKRPYNMYGSPKEIFTTYLDENEFISFYEVLGEQLKKTEGEEHKRLMSLYTALTFTRLQLAYYKSDDINGAIIKENKSIAFRSLVKQGIKQLESAGMYNVLKYKEVEGDWDDYILGWREILDKERHENLILDSPLILKGSKGNTLVSSKRLTDGLLGFRSDYHLGWYMSTEDRLSILLDTKYLQGNKSLSIRFLVHNKHRFYPPAEVEIWLDNKLLQTVESQAYKYSNNIAETSIKLDLTAINSLTIVLVKEQGERVTMALDEIQLTN